LASLGASGSGGSGADSDAYAVGDRIEALYKGKGKKYYKGKVTRVNRDGTYDLEFDDGDKDLGALAKNMRRAGSATITARSPSRGGLASLEEVSGESDDAFAVGDRIEALYKGKGTRYYKGKVTRVNRDGTYDLEYDDGDKDLGALAKNIRRLNSGGVHTASRPSGRPSHGVCLPCPSEPQLCR